MLGRRPNPLAALLFVAAASFSAEANAAEPAELTWNVPEGCPTKEAVLAELQKLAGPGASDLRASITIRLTGSFTFAAEILTEAAGIHGTRSFEGRTCSALTAAIVVLLALAADPYALTEPAPAPSSSPSPARPLLDPDRAPRFAPEVPEPRSPWALGLHAGVATGLDVGTLTTMAPGAGLVLAATSGPLRFEAQGSLWMNQFVAGDATSARGVEMGFESLALRGCGDIRGTSVSVGGCAGTDWIWMHGRGVGVESPASDRTVWADVEAGLWVRQVSVGRFNVYGGLSALVPLRRPTGTISGMGVVYRPWPVTVLGTLGVDLRLL